MAGGGKKVVYGREKLRILIANSTLHIGGAEKVAADLARQLDRERFDVTVCFLKENGIVGEFLEADGVELVSLPGLVAGKVDFLTSLKLNKLLRTRRFHLLHTHDLHGLIDGCVCRRLTPSMVHVHTFHSGEYPIREPSILRTERLLWRLPDQLVAVGKKQRNTIMSTYKIPAKDIKVVWNGVDLPLSNLDERIRRVKEGERRVVIGSISTMSKSEQKGIPYLLEAARILRDRRRKFLLLLIGDGTRRRDYERRAEDLGIEKNVRFLGWIPDAASKALPGIDVFVQPSLWEAMSIVVLEAMATGRPVVVTRVGENEHVVEHEHSGLLVPPRDSVSLADSLERLVNDVELRQRLGSASRARYLQYFTIAHMVKNYESLYEDLLFDSR